MLEERDERSGHRHDLLGAHVHVVDLAGPGLGEQLAMTGRHPLIDEVALLVEPGVGLGDVALLLVVGGEVLDLRGHAGLDPESLALLCLELGHGSIGEGLALLKDDLALGGDEVLAGDLVEQALVLVVDKALHLAVGRLDEAVLVDAAVRGERADETDVRALGRLDGADAAVVAVVDVANVEAGALTREATRSQRREAALAGELGQRIGLVHELRELAATEELLHGGHDRADVDEHVGRRLVRLLDGHALLDHALHAQQADAEGVLDELAVGADAAVAEVVDVIGGAQAVVELDEVADDDGDVFLGDGALDIRQLDAHAVGHRAQLLVELVAADAAEVIAAEVEEEALDQLLGVVTCGRVAGAQLLVDLDERLYARRGGVLLEGLADEADLTGIDRLEEGRDLLVGLIANGTEQLGRFQLALAVDLDEQHVLGRRLELQPRSTVGDDLGAEELAAGGGVLGVGVVHAGTAHELAHHDALGAVDDERAALGHAREVAHVDALLKLLAGLLDVQLDIHVERTAEGQVTGAALELVVLGITELVGVEVQLHGLAGEVLDGADLIKEVTQSALHEPVVRLALKLDQVGDGKDLGDPGVSLALQRHGRTPTIDFRQGHGALLASGRGAQGTGIRPHGSLKGKGPRSPTAKDTASRANRQRWVDTANEGGAKASLGRWQWVGYLISTLAPCSSRAALIFSASALSTPSLTALGWESTRSLASLRPRPVSSRTALMTGILLGPISTSTASNSVCSSSAAAAPGAAATATAAGAAAVTP